jgi:ppGpp synthetase/RelA/SpoT-type nucleotidyltranferase
MVGEDEEHILTWEEYPAWLANKCGEVSLGNERSRFDVVGAKLRDDIAQSDFWASFVALRQEFDDEYFTQTGFRLFASMESPAIHVKPYQSLLDKTYRKNILLNANLPECPKDGWITPLNWYDSINDLVRTTAVVKYLDGVEFLVERLRRLAERSSHDFDIDYEARDEGYYAAHCYVRFQVEIPKTNWETERVRPRLEIQITTQVQDVIRKLTHQYYERRRSSPEMPSRKWQWDYTSPEFVPNYLGHILHYVEGMIMEVRARGE